MLEKIRNDIELFILSNKQRQFLNDLEDSEYRKVFAEELIGTSLAFQIRRLREARGLTQEELAQIAGKAQETISQWENPDYGRYTLSTLETLAGAFDVGLLVRFVSFSELADWIIDVSPSRLTPSSYAEEQERASSEVQGSIFDVGIEAYPASPQGNNRPIVDDIGQILSENSGLSVPNVDAVDAYEGEYADAVAR